MPISAPQNLAQLAGVPSQWSDTITGTHVHLLASDTPLVVTQDLPMDLDQTVSAYTPVAWNEDGDGLVPAAPGEPAIGITLKDIVVAATGDRPGVPILIQAALNIDAIAWPAAYNTDALKFAAFSGAATPTNIVLKRVYRGSVVAQP